MEEGDRAEALPEHLLRKRIKKRPGLYRTGPIKGVPCPIRPVRSAGELVWGVSYTTNGVK
jgi:hypothetical protein